MAVTCAFTYDELLEYTDAETEKWRSWFAQNPSALDVPFAEGRLATIRGLLIHIFAVELRYAERASGQEATSYDDIHAHSLDEIFALATRARSLLRKFISTMTDAEAGVILTFPTMTAGTITASKRKIASNTFLHGIRHWGQVATVLRLAGFHTTWGHDLLLSQTEM